MSFQFGQYKVDTSELFYDSKYCVGLVNLKPIVPGHVLIVPKRVVLRYAELSEDEIMDLTKAVISVSRVLENEYEEMKHGSIWLIQDGKEAGQTIHHVHLHIIPKRFSAWCGKESIEDSRMPRTRNEMKEEAERLKIKCTVWPDKTL